MTQSLGVALDQGLTAGFADDTHTSSASAPSTLLSLSPPIPVNTSAGVSPQASASAYAGLDAASAVALASQVFGVGNTADETLTPPGTSIVSYLGSNDVLVREADGTRVVASSDIPWRVDDGSGLKPVSLTLAQNSQGAFTPANAAVPVTLPAGTSGDFTLPGDVGVHVGAIGAAPGTIVGGRVFYANSARDTDFMLQPTFAGVDAQWQLRSASSPAVNTLVFNLPAGATLALSSTVPGGAEVDAGGQAIVTIAPAIAEDASGVTLPVSYAVSGDTLSVSVDLSGVVQYPVLVDPEFAVSFGSGAWGNCGFSASSGGSGSDTGSLDVWALKNATSGSWSSWTCTAPSYTPGVVGIAEADTTNLIHRAQTNNSSSIMTVGLSGNVGSCPGYYGTIATQSCSSSVLVTRTAYTSSNYEDFCAQIATAYSCNPAFGAQYYVNQQQMQTTEKAAGNDQVQTPNLTLDYEDSTAPNQPTYSELGGTPYSGSWYKGTPSYSFTETDPGLGMWSLNDYLNAGQTPVGNAYPLPGGAQHSTTNGCANLNGYTPECQPSISVAAVSESQTGIYTATAVGDNPFGLSNSNHVTFGVDDNTPTATGSIANASTGADGAYQIGNGSYALNVSATDGTVTPNSGITSIQVAIDGTALPTTEAASGCPFAATGTINSNCYTLSGSYTLNGNQYTQGTLHTVTVTATNGVNTQGSYQFTFMVNPAAEAPIGPGSVNLSTGEFSLDNTDVSIPGFGTTLSVNRAYNSRTGPTSGPLGPAWQLSVPAGQAGGDFTSLIQQGGAEGGNVTLVDDSGSKSAFTVATTTLNGSTYTLTFTPPPGDETLNLVETTTSPTGAANLTTYTLTDSAGDVTTFTANGNTFMASQLTQPTGQPSQPIKETVTYAAIGGTSTIAPEYAVSAATSSLAATCTPNTNGILTWIFAGCRALDFIYDASGFTSPAADPCPTSEVVNGTTYTDAPNQLSEIDFVAADPTPPSPSQNTPQNPPVTATPVACYLYNTNANGGDVLAVEWDPRTESIATSTGPQTNLAGLQTSYAYIQSTLGVGPGWLLTGITPPGAASGSAAQWTLAYGASPFGSTDTNPGSLQSATECPSTQGQACQVGGMTSETSTVVYNVPVSQAQGGPYALDATSAAAWGEPVSGSQWSTLNGENTPVTGTAIFPPSATTANYNQATIYYLDSFGDEVNVASPPARVLQYGPANKTAPGLDSGSKPDQAALGSDGNVWVTDDGTTQAIDQITPTGSVTPFALASGSVPGAITNGPDGNLWFTDASTPASVDEITPTGSVTRNPLGSNHIPTAIATVGGNVWFTDQGTHEIGEFSTANPSAITWYALNNPNGATAVPTAITAGPDGNVWFTDAAPTGPAVGEIVISNGTVDEYSLPAGSDPTSIAAGPNDQLWFTDSTVANHRIGDFAPPTPPGTAPTIQWTAVPSGNVPSAITLGSDGNMWFVETTAGQVGKITPSGTVSEYVVGSASNPTGIATGSDGALWFSEQSAVGAIGRITTAGVTSQGWISTTQYDSNFNVISSLSAQNRLEALASSNSPTATAAEAGLLSSESFYNTTTGADGAPVGTELDETLGPQHNTAIANTSSGCTSGTVVPGRAETSYTYDTNQPSTGGPYYLVTSETTGANVSSTVECDQRTTQTNYSGQSGLGWTLREPTSVQVDPSGLDLTTTTFYDPATGQPIETVQPADPTPSGPSTTGTGSSTDASAEQTYYYTVGSDTPVPAYCRSQPALAGLVCETQPATQPTNSAGQGIPASMPSLPITSGPESIPGPPSQGITYNIWDQPVTAEQVVWNTAGTADWRTTSDTYGSDTGVNADGNVLTSSSVQSSVGTQLQPVTYTYYPATGLLDTESSATGYGSPQIANTTITNTYDGYGRLSTYTEGYTAQNGADNQTTCGSAAPDSYMACNTANYGYDSDGRVTSVSDTGDSSNGQTANNAQTGYTYDTYTGYLTAVTDPSGISFYGTYDADGKLLSQTFPNAMSANETYDETGAPTALNYLQFENCGQASPCTAYNDGVTSNVYGEWLTQSSSLSTEAYSYDTDARLIQAAQTPAANGAVCTTRQYGFNADSDRTASVTSVSSSQTCTPASLPLASTDTFDSADRLTDPGTAYDSFGRVTIMPATNLVGISLTGGSSLGTSQSPTSYYANDYLNSLSQTVTQNNVPTAYATTYTLDPANRILERSESETPQGGSATTTNQLSFYDGSSDNPAWTENVNSSGQPNGTWTRNITGIDDELDAIQTNNGTQPATQLQLSNLHGDDIGTVLASPTGTVQLSCEGSEYGVPCATNQSTTYPIYGYLGAKNKSTELPSGVINMGARVYDPYTGTFLQTDPEPGADANAYGYTDGDPVNEEDLTGRCTLGQDVDEQDGCGAVDTVLNLLGFGGAERAYHKAVLAAQPAATFVIVGFASDGFGDAFDGLGEISIDNPESFTGVSADDVPNHLPSDFEAEPTRGAGGTRYMNPKAPGEQVRVMPGNKDDPNPVKQGPYLRVSKGGKVSGPVPLRGNPTL